MGLLAMEMFKFMVPLLPPAEGGENSRHYPWIITKGVESSQVTEAQQRLCTPVAGSAFIAKILKGSVKQSDDSQACKKKSKPKVPNLEDEPEGGRRPKAKAKGKAKAAGTKRKASGMLEETAEDLQDDVAFEMHAAGALHPGTRPRRWMDDLLGALTAANNGKPLDAPYDTPKGRLIALLVSYGLEFALTGRLALGKKVFKDWSKARG